MAQSKMKLFLDLDGPILDVKKRYYAIYTDFFLKKKCEKNLLNCEEYWALKRNKISELKILERSGLESYIEEYEIFRLKNLESDEYEVYDQLQEGVLNTLQKLAQTNELILVTLRKDRLILEKTLKRLNLKEFFSEILSGDDGTNPRWRIKVMMIESRFKKEDLSKSFFIGDTETDIEAGKSIGCKTVACSNGIRSDSLLNKTQADYSVPNLTAFLQGLNKLQQFSRSTVERV